MNQATWTRIRVAFGTVLLTVALALLVHGVLGGSGILQNRSVRTVATLLALAGLFVAAWRLRTRPDAEDGEGGWDAPVRRAARYRLVESPPERAAIDHPLAGGDGSALLARASEAASDAGSVDAGVELVRPALRGLLRDVLVAGGATESAAELAIDEGTWTENATAAAVLSPDVDPPSRSLRERVRAWLVPDRAVRERMDRTVAAMAAAAERDLPPVPGRAAPRRVTVEPPTLAELQRDVDGSLRRAVSADGRIRSFGQDGTDTETTPPTKIGPDDATRKAEQAGGKAGEGER